MHDSLNDDEKEKVRKDDNKIKKEKRGNLDNGDKEQLKKYDHLDHDGKEQLRKYEKKGKKFMRDNRNHDDKEQVRKDDNKRKKENAVTLIMMKNNN